MLRSGGELEAGAAGLGTGAWHGAGFSYCRGRGAELLEQPLHVFAEAIVLDLESMPRRILPAEAMADIGMGACFQRSEPGGALLVLGFGHDEACDQPRLIIGELPNAALRGLEQPDDEEIIERA